MPFRVSLALIALLSVILAGCAIVRPPQGGDKDESGPELKKSEPIIGSTNFKGNEIQMDFDEFIVLNNFSQELTVSPPLNKEPEYRIKGKSLIIKFDDTLATNTTYTFNLGDGIKDFHEGNILDSANFMVFSTGEDIDSGFVWGSLYDAENLSPLSKLLVMLYPQFDDSIPAQIKPTYFAKSKEDGSFQINYLKTGKYQLFVLEDKNSNYLYDLPNERIGFAPMEIEIEGSIGITNARVGVFQEYIPNQFFVGATPLQYGKLLLAFNQPVKDLTIKPIQDVQLPGSWYDVDYDANRDSVVFWTNTSQFEGKEIQFEITDKGEVLDTFSLTVAPLPKKEAEQKVLLPSFGLNDKAGVVKYFEPIVLRCSNPIRSINLNGLFIQGKDTMKLSGKRKDTHSFEFDAPLQEEKDYSIVIYSNSFEDHLGFFNDTLQYSLRTLSSMEYASLKINVMAPAGMKGLLQFINSANNQVLIEKKSSGGDIELSNLSPGKYRLKLIFDENENGLWDPGSFIPRKQAERVIFFPEEIEIKEGWDKKIDWTIPE